VAECKKYTCSIYKDRPSGCRDYPLEATELEAQFYFEDCQYIKDGEKFEPDTSVEEQSEYCVNCGMCCYFMSPLKLQMETGIVFGSKKWWFDNATKCSKLEIDGQLEPKEGDMIPTEFGMIRPLSGSVYTNTNSNFKHRIVIGGPEV
jgi:hypothetical protein